MSSLRPRRGRCRCQAMTLIGIRVSCSSLVRGWGAWCSGGQPDRASRNGLVAEAKFTRVGSGNPNAEPFAGSMALVP